MHRGTVGATGGTAEGPGICIVGGGIATVAAAVRGAGRGGCATKTSFWGLGRGISYATIACFPSLTGQIMVVYVNRSP